MKNGVTIGIPVYNEEQRIERAVRSAAPQCERLIVADNASTDATEAACKRLLAEFPNMEYVRHPENGGSLKNCVYLLDQVKTPYYLTLGSHDWIAPDYVEKTSAVLAGDPGAVLAVGEVCADFGGGMEPMPGVKSWNGIVGGTPRERVDELVHTREVVTAWTCYGLFRTSELRTAHAQGTMTQHAPDMVLLGRMAQRGKLVVTHATQYYAWIRREDSRRDYYHRISAQIIDRQTQARLRAETRRVLYDLFMEQHGEAGPVQRGLLRFLIMTRIGLFRTSKRDGLFYLLYVPVKLRRALQRLGRKNRRAS